MSRFHALVAGLCSLIGYGLGLHHFVFAVTTLLASYALPPECFAQMMGWSQGTTKGLVSEFRQGTTYALTGSQGHCFPNRGSSAERVWRAGFRVGKALGGQGVAPARTNPSLSITGGRSL